MKIGVCAKPDKLPLLSSLGYDYFEANFSWLATLDEDAFREQAAIVEKYALAAEALNGFFKSDMSLYTQNDKHTSLLKEISAYAEKGFSRASSLGGKVAVIGSGASRAIREGMTREKAEEQFARVLSVCGEAADKYGMRVTVEPLSFNDCNYIHTVDEGATVAKLSGHSAVGVMVDFYHHWKNNDRLESLPDYANHLWHAHYGRPGDRNAPDAGDISHLRVCAEVLKKCPYVDRISLECIYAPDFTTTITAAREPMEIFRSIRSKSDHNKF